MLVGFRYSVDVRTLRDRVRIIALIWLVGQVASLGAFVPENCCLSHVEERAAEDQQAACHESEPAAAPAPGDACPMQHDAGAACAMHGARTSGDCVMTNACNGPGSHLLSLFAFIAAIERPLSTEITLDSVTAVVAPAAAPLFRFTSPDAPPPKA